MLCKRHALEAGRQIKAAAKKKVAEETKVRGNYLGNHLGEILTDCAKAAEPPLFVQQHPSPLKALPVGRPPRYSPLDRLKMALAALDTSLRAVGDVYGVIKAQSYDDLAAPTSPNRDTVAHCLAELAQAFLFELATVMSESTSVGIMIDATTDRARELLAVHLQGVHDGVEWAFPVEVVETVGHSAQIQVEVVKKLLNGIAERQRGMGVKESKLYHIVSMTADNTSSNTGERGVRGLLQLAREETWQRDGQPGKCPELVFKGCEDHIINLIAVEFDKRVVLRAQSWQLADIVINETHASASALVHIMGRLRSPIFRRAFRGFVRHSGGKDTAIERYSETRYASLAVLSLRWMQDRPIIIAFLHRVRTLLTAIDLKQLEILLGADVQEVVRVRALLAAFVLLPVMGKAAKIKEAVAWRGELDSLDRRLAVLHRSPQLLSGVKITGPNSHLLPHIIEQLEAIRSDVREQTPALADTTEDAIVRVTAIAAATEPELEEGEIVEEEPEEIEVLRGHAAPDPSFITCERPSNAVVPRPSLEEQTKTLIKDAVESVLYMQRRHHADWSTASKIAVTSRPVERMFAVAKLKLERSTQTRVALLSPLVCLHAVPREHLVRCWRKHEHRGLRKLARQAVAANPKTADVDLAFMEKAFKQADERAQQIEKEQEDKRLTDFIGTLGVRLEKKRPRKHELEQALGQEAVKRLKIENGGKEPSVLKLKEAIGALHKASLVSVGQPAAITSS